MNKAKSDKKFLRSSAAWALFAGLAASPQALAQEQQAPPQPAAEAAMAEFRAYDPDWTQAKSAAYPYRNNSDRDHWLDGLGKAGLP